MYEKINKNQAGNIKKSQWVGCEKVDKGKASILVKEHELHKAFKIRVNNNSVLKS